MRHIKTELTLKNSVKFTQSCLNLHNNLASLGKIETTPLPSSSSSVQNNEFESIQQSEDCFGGVIKTGQLGWLAKGPLFEVFSLKTGQKISSFRFDLNLGFENCIVTCVAEIDVTDLNFCVLAICIQFNDTPGGVIVLCSVQELSKIIRCIEIKEKITSCHYIAKGITKRTLLQMFNGCLAIGTDNGEVILLDLDLRKCEEGLFSSENDEDDIELVQCHIIKSTTDLHHLTLHYQHSKHENIHFGIKLDAVNESTLILSIISIINILSLAIGLEDGRLIIFDLSEFQISYIIKSPSNKLLPLVKLTYLEPADDPRACIYLWALHEGKEPTTALMYSIMYDKKLIEDDGTCLFEDFESCSLRLTLNTSEIGGIPIACQSIFKQSVNDDESEISLCLFAWKQQNSTQVLLFDLNQWYNEMPNYGSPNGEDSYLAFFSLKECNALDMYIDPNTVASFNSIQRLEEHFRAISLSFDCVILNQNGYSHFHWPGLQNRALEIFKSGGALALLEPTPYFHEIILASLMPQFCNRKFDSRRLSLQSQYSNDSIMETSGILENFNTIFSINDQRNILLSVALENNCFGLLKECAVSWADGSHLGLKPAEGLSLSTLTEWIWQRANAIKKRCNVLCIPLFDHSGLEIDQRSRKELSHLLRQLKLLSDLMGIILKKCKEYIPNDAFDSLSNQQKSIQIAAEYQEIVLWLLNVGILPEGIPDSNDDVNLKNTWRRSNLIPYPYKTLKELYSSKRKRIGEIFKTSICSRTGSCKVLFIDAFIDRECNSNVLRDHWIECDGNGLYPPPSLQAMLRTMLLPDVSIENKYVLFIYLFLDLNMVIENERHAAIVRNLIKFPAVFKLNASLIKTVQAFWSLDQGQFETAVEELISPFSQDRKLSQWQKELLVESMLAQKQPNLALRALQSPSAPISPILELKTLMTNDLLAEAFHLQRAKNDPGLFRQFLAGCLCLGKLAVLRDLAFTEEESKIIDEFFEDSKSSKGKNLHFVYLLQRSKYIDATSYLDKIRKSNKQQLHHSEYDLETPNLILSAFNSTMTPASEKLANIYYGIRNKIQAVDVVNPLPLSSELLRHDVNKITGGIYHSSIISVDQATIYWDENVCKQQNRLIDTNNVPFIRAPQCIDIPTDFCKGGGDSISYPEVFKSTQKRKLENYNSFDVEDNINELDNPKKRRKIIDSNSFITKNQNLNGSLLTRFKEKTNQDIYNRTERNSVNSASKQNSINEASSVLNTPIVKSSRKIDTKDEYDSADDRPHTPQSILKGRNPASRTSSRAHVKRKLNVDGNEITDDEKSIRFDLSKKENSPDTKHSSPSHYLSKDVERAESKKQKENVEITRQDGEKAEENKEQEEDSINLRLYSGPKKRKPLKRSRIDSKLMVSEIEDHHVRNSSKDSVEILEKSSINKKSKSNNIPLWGETPKSYEPIPEIKKCYVERYIQDQQIPLSRKVLEVNAIKIIEKEAKEITEICRKTVEKTFTVVKKSVAENSEISFEPYLFTSSKIFESSTPVVNEKRSSGIKSSQKEINDSYKESTSLNLFSEYSSVMEKTEKEGNEDDQEETIINTAITTENSTLKPPTLSLTTTIDLSEISKDKRISEEFFSPRDSEIDQENDKEMSFKDIEEKNECLENLKNQKEEKENQTYDVTYSNKNEPELQIDYENKESVDEEDEFSEKIRISNSSTNDSENEDDDENFSVESRENVKSSEDDEIYSISSADTIEAFIDSKDDENENNCNLNIEEVEEEKADSCTYYESSSSSSSGLFYEGFEEEVKLAFGDDDDIEGFTLQVENKDEKVESVGENETVKSFAGEKEGQDNINTETLDLNEQSNKMGCLESLHPEFSSEDNNQNHLQRSAVFVDKTETLKQTETTDMFNVNVQIPVEKFSSNEPMQFAVQIEELMSYTEGETTTKSNEPKKDSSEIKLNEVYVEGKSENVEIKKIDELKHEYENSESHKKENTSLEKSDSSNYTIKTNQVVPVKKRKLKSEKQINDSNSFVPDKSTKKNLQSRRARSESIDIERNLTPSTESFTESRNSPIPSNRLKRAKSVSTDTPPLTPTRILTRRQSALLNRIEEDTVLQSPSRSVTPSTPNRVLTRRQSALLDRIEEDSALGTPKVLESTMNEGELERPLSVAKKTRKSSIGTNEMPKTSRKPKENITKEKIKPIELESSLDEDETVTKKENVQQQKITSRKKAKSVEPENVKQQEFQRVKNKMKAYKSEENLENKPDERKTKINLKKEKSVEPEIKKKNRTTTPKPSSNQGDNDDGDDRTEAKSKRKKNNKSDIKEEKSAVEQLSEENNSNAGRLTRSKQAVVLLNRQNSVASPSKEMSTSSESRTIKSEDNSDNESEVESIISTRSRKSLSSKAGVRRQTRQSVKDDDETSSIGSSNISQITNKSTKSKKSKNQILKTICEEQKSENKDDSNDDNDSISQSSKKRGRSQKTKK